jgi:hypothetical protein
MMFTHFMGMNLSTLPNGTQNYDTQSMTWVSNHFSIDMPNVPSPFPSSPCPTYMNPCFGFGGTMAPPSTFSFDRSHVPQPTLIMGGWNLPSYGSRPSHVFSVAHTQMVGYSTYCTSSMYPSSAMPIPMNTFPMEGSHISSGISYEGNQFYGSGYPLHETLSHGGNIYPHFCLFADNYFSDDARTNLYRSIRWRILPFRVGIGCKPGPFLACNVSKPVFPRTLVSYTTTHHHCYSSHCQSYWIPITNHC